jgi:coenzyme Q-binding protein COQ10
MTLHSSSRSIQAPLEAVFDLVADVEQYPDFLPMWREAKIIGRDDGDAYQTEQVVGIGPLEQRFCTHTTLVRPTRIEVSSPDPLFRRFFIRWDFAPSGCRIGITLDWEVESRPMQRAIALLLPGVATTMVEAFERRARHVLWS